MTSAASGPVPVQQVGEIVAARDVGAYRLITVAAPGVAQGVRPGHFVAVGVGGPETSMLLRRSFALYAAVEGVVSFVVAAHGPGTRWLVSQPVGAALDLVGPLGTPFAPAPGEPAVLVGGGYGSAPLIPLARELVDGATPVEFVLGAATADRLFGVAEARVLAPVTVTTDDGSVGTRGRVTDVLPDLVRRIGARAVYACGPMAMLRAVGMVARQHAVPAQVAVEESMACGIGVCMTCVLPVCGSDGRSRFVRSCVEGPVFAADRVRWDDVGSLPGDLVGADAMAGR